MTNYEEFKSQETTLYKIKNEITSYQALLAMDAAAKKKGQKSPVPKSELAEAKAGILELEEELVKVHSELEKLYFNMNDADKKILNNSGKSKLAQMGISSFRK